TNVTTAPTGTLTLNSAGNITQAPGTVITAGALTGSSSGATTLTNANRIAVLDAFRAGTDFTLTDAQALDVRGIDVKSLGFTGVKSGAGGVSGDLTLITTGAGSNLTASTPTLSAAAGAGNVTLNSSGSFTRTTGAITGNTVTLAVT